MEVAMLRRLLAWHDAHLDNPFYFAISAGVFTWAVIGVAAGVIFGCIYITATWTT
jgi:hypothetical protein